MIRTPELDKHWAGMYYCLDCKLYTGCPDNHIGHRAIYLPECKHETIYVTVLGEGY